MKKRCSKCKEEKLDSDFYQNRRTKDGFSTYCKACQKQQAQDWQRENREHYLKLTRDRTRERRRKNPGLANREAMERHPKKHRARLTLQKAVATGRLTKPGRCEDCSELTPKHKLHGHHEDHAKPLEVDWLCHGCHVNRHGAAQ